MKNMEFKKEIKYALDTNILIYAINENSQFFETARLIIDSIQNYQIYVSDKTLYEFYAVISNLFKDDLSIAYDLFDKMLNIFDGKIIRSKENTIGLVRDFIESEAKSGKYVHDLVLAAICVDNQVDVLISQNVKDFEGLKALKVQRIY